MIKSEPNNKPNSKRKVTVIKPTKTFVGDTSYPRVYGKYRTVAYCRSATYEEELKGTYTTQEKLYTKIIKNKPDWEFKGVYGDKGRDYVSHNGNTGLAKLIDTARKGQVDLVVMSFDSCYGKATAETANLLNSLRSYDVGVKYESGGKILSYRKIKILLEDAFKDHKDPLNGISLPNNW